MAKTLQDQKIEELEDRIRRLERMQPDPITVEDDAGAQVIIGTQGGLFGIRIIDSAGAVQHNLTV